MKILTFDIESCTGNTLDGSLCSFGYILTENGEVLDSGDILCNPLPQTFTLGRFGKKLAYPVKHFRSQPRFNKQYPTIKALFSQADLVLGFAVQNDIKYLNNACDCFNLPHFEFKFLDVQLIAGLAVPELMNHGLKAFADRYGVEFAEHRSDEDARATWLVFDGAIKESGKLLEDILKENGVHYGRNVQEGHYNCFAESCIRERIKAGGRTVRKLLTRFYVEYYAVNCAKAGELLKGKRVCISESVAQNSTVTQRIISSTFTQGGYYESSILRCNIFIGEEGDKETEKFKKTNKRSKIMSAESFLKEYSFYASAVLSDEELLISHHSKLIVDKAETA